MRCVCVYMVYVCTCVCGSVSNYTYNRSLEKQAPVVSFCFLLISLLLSITT